MRLSASGPSTEGGKLPAHAFLSVRVFIGFRV